MEKTIVLTGASGFVGGEFLRRFESLYKIHKVNLRDTSLDKVDFRSADSVVHCAALVHQMKGAPEERYFSVNTDLTLSLAKIAKSQGVGHFVFLSTAHVFGDSGTLNDHKLKLTENSPCLAYDPYGRSKVAAEKGLLDLADENFRVAILRPPMVYGKGAKGNIISLIKVIKKLPIVPLGFYENRRSLIYVGNLTHYIASVIEKRATGIFLPQDPQAISIGQLVRYISIALNKKVLILPLPLLFMGVLYNFFPKSSARLFGSLALDSTEGDSKSGYKAKYSTEEALTEMLRSSSVL